MAAAVVSPRATQTRVASIDALRGFVMIIMALDHVREFFYSDMIRPEDMAHSTPALFLTRWITHICAPVFMFTAGVGAFFWLRHRGRTNGQLSQFLWKRGLWLVVLELTMLRLGMNLDFFSGPVMLTVLWALGWSMVALSVLVFLPVRVLAVASVVVIVSHNLLDGVSAGQFGSAGWIWNIVHQQGMFRAGGMTVVVAYPLVPWIMVMAAGFCFGRIMLLDPEQRRQWLIRIGVGLTAAFVIVRGINRYGDPAPWSTQPPGMTVFSFLNCIKYPPSLDFLLMTLGPAILLLAWFDRVQFRRTNPLIVFGRVPLFYFLVHFFVAHGLALVCALLRYGQAGFILSVIPSRTGPDMRPADYGYSLLTVYAVWGTVVAILYPMCKWYSRVKERNPDWKWLSYV